MAALGSPETFVLDIIFQLQNSETCKLVKTFRKVVF